MNQENSQELKKSLGLSDLVLLNITTIVGLTSLPQVAQFGMASSFMYLLAIALFFIPIGLMVAELSTIMPGEGGFYIWTKKAFGDVHGFVVGWSYWLSNVVWLPTVMLLIVTSATYLLGGQHAGLAEDPVYIGISTLSLLWVITGLNIIGMDKAKWIQNIAGISIWLCILLLTGLAIYHLIQSGSDPLTNQSWIPDFTDFGILPFFAAVAFAFGGLELAPVMAGEIKRPKKNIPRAIFITSIGVGIIYLIGTISVIVLIPGGQVNIIDGVAQAFHTIGGSIDRSWITPIGISLVLLSTLGLFGSWLTGTARLPFVIGLDNFLPRRLGRVHRKYGTPYVSLILQGIILSLFMSASFLGATLQDAFLILYDMAVILYFIPFLYMFGALVVHVKRNTGKGVIDFFKGKSWKVWVVAGSGFSVTLIAAVLACIPSDAVAKPSLFLLKVIGGSILFLGVGLLIFFLRRNQPKNSDSNR